MTKRQRQAKHAAEHRHMRDRLLRIREAASDDVIEAGRLWYPSAENVIADLSREYQIGRPRVAAVVAVFSPRQRWRKNIEAARAMLAGESWRAACYPANKSKASAILLGLPLDMRMGGDKVTSFWANLIGSRTAVTVDVWAHRAASGRYHPHQAKDARYARIARAYRAAAEVAGETPREFQCVVWNAIRPAVEHKKDWEAIYA